jgi:hypothetical protein
MRNPAILTLCLGLGLLCLPKAAHALGPLDLEAGAKVGGGSNILGHGEPNPLGFGLGGRAGVSIFGLYGGVNLVYYLGSSQNETFDGASVTAKDHALQYGFEFGYGLKLGPLTLRGQVGVGNFELTASGALGGDSESASKGYLYLEPGVVGLISIGHLYFGADVNALLLPAGPNDNPSSGSAHAFDSALTAHGQVGVRF